MKSSVTKFQAFPITLIIIEAKDQKEIDSWSSKNKVVYDDDPLDYEECAATSGRVSIDKKPGILIVFNEEYLTHGTISHEALHALGYLYEWINQEFELQSEPQNYLLEWVVDQCYDTLEIPKIKRAKK